MLVFLSVRLRLPFVVKVAGIEGLASASAAASGQVPDVVGLHGWGGFVQTLEGNQAVLTRQLHEEGIAQSIVEQSIEGSKG